MHDIAGEDDEDFTTYGTVWDTQDQEAIAFFAVGK